MRFQSFLSFNAVLRRRAGLALLPLAALWLVGCGGGGNSRFAPNEIPNLVLWLDAQAIEGARDGDPLGTWRDSSGQRNDAVQESGTKRPEYTANAHGSLPAVRFDGQNDVLTVPDSNSLDMSTGDLSILVVYSRADSPGNNLRLLAKGATTDRSQGYAIMGSNEGLVLIVSNGNAERLLVNSFDQLVSRATLSTFVVNRGSQMLAYRDGASKGAVNLRSFGISTWNNDIDLTVGGQNPTPDIPWKGDIMELLIYKRHLSELERVALEIYLADKWAIELEEEEVQGRVRGIPRTFY